MPRKNPNWQVSDIVGMNYSKTTHFLPIINLPCLLPQVQPVALQLVLDRSLHPEVRMVACIVLFEAKPSVALVTSLAGALKTETNMHVVSFVYSHIKSLTRITAPDMAAV